jgi:uncharacterized protein
MSLYKTVLLFIFFTKTIFIFAQGEKIAASDYRKSIETHREKYLNDFLNDEKSPVKKEDIPFIHFFDIDAKYRFEAVFTKAVNEKPFDLATTAGKMKQYIKYGELTFVFEQKNITISIYKPVAFANHPLYKDYLFIPFKDLTTGETTYGAGRYIDAKLSDITDNKMIIDFNKCYNPYCAYSEGYNCPIPPKENTLEIAIVAGEQNFGKAKH